MQGWLFVHCSDPFACAKQIVRQSLTAGFGPDIVNPMTTIKIVGYDDWFGLYVDGTIYHQGHDIPQFVWVELLQGLYGLDVERHSNKAVYEWMLDNGHLPTDYADLPEEVLTGEE